MGDRDGLLNYCPNSGTATSPSYSCTDSYSDSTPAGNPFISIDIRKTDKGGVVTSGASGGDHSYTKPYAVDIVRVFFVIFFKYLFAGIDVTFFGKFINSFFFPSIIGQRWQH